MAVLSESWAPLLSLVKDLGMTGVNSFGHMTDDVMIKGGNAQSPRIFLKPGPIFIVLL